MQPMWYYDSVVARNNKKKLPSNLISQKWRPHN